ncbi:beta-1,3-glucan-binding protein-like isoform X2 [Pararge aegeria]|uniref:beta-1,3-glucan-binding protein-like isoform X2 n=1 Tax=Pararge aegeria TaxID=116150 RepID=UPI0019D0350A|nr:beta-1,3-glucan-binding protein-like isoform X2 [Pararge aegeria]
MISWSDVLCLVLVGLINCQNSDQTYPNVTVTLRALHPKGFRAYISANADQTNNIVFNGILYENMEKARNSESDIGLLWGFATRKAHSEWLFEDHFVTLAVGTVIKYGIFIPDQHPKGASKNGRASLTLDGAEPDFKFFRVSYLVDPLTPGPNCLPTLTKVRGKTVCAGEVIFQDNFDTLREDLWQIEQYIPTDHPEHPFLSYQKLDTDRNVYVEDGILNIVPKLQEDLIRKYSSILTGSLDLSDGCTRRKCSKVAFGWDILPPIVSGRLTSVNFAFTYGTVYIKAKLPDGDWLYPEILLEPVFKKFDGQKELASIIKIALAGGKREITANKKHRGMPNMEQRCYDGRQYTISETLRYGHGTYNFHEYSLRWTPDVIEFSMNWNPYLRYYLTDEGWAYRCFEDVSSDFRPSHNDYENKRLPCNLL